MRLPSPIFLWLCLLPIAGAQEQPIVPARDTITPFVVKPAKAEDLPPVPRPGPAPEVALSSLTDSRDRGVAFLLKSQRPSGAWGGPTNTKALNIAAEPPGSHYAFTAATTALAIEALILSSPESPEVKAALEKAETWLLDFIPKVKRPSPEELYNNWTHSYCINAFILLSQRPGIDVAKKSRLLEAAQSQVAMLQRFEFVDGGWGYYDFDMKTAKPSGIGTSFTTATALIALHKAKEAGLEVPGKMVDNAVRAVLMQRTKDGAYVYSFQHRTRPRVLINRPAGSLGRAPACNAALRAWTGTKYISDQDIKDWLDRLITRGGWLDIARKRPVPHDIWFQNSGYFFYYGQYYAAWCTHLLPEADRPFYRAHLATGLLRLQEKDGSWWDYPLYDYHQPYGTAFALTSLACLEPRLKSTPAANPVSTP